MGSPALDYVSKVPIMEKMNWSSLVSEVMYRGAKYREKVWVNNVYVPVVNWVEGELEGFKTSALGKGIVFHAKEAVAGVEYDHLIIKSATKCAAGTITRELTEVAHRSAKAWEKKPKGWDKGSMKSHWDSLGGSVTDCMKKMKGHVDNPGAYCNSLRHAVGAK